MAQKIIVAVFLLFIAAGSILFYFMPKSVYSEDENRYLAEKPELTLKNIAKGQYMTQVEDYVNDHFPLRLAWIQLKTRLELASGKKESNGVYIINESHYIESFKKYNEQQVSKNKEYLIGFAQKVENITGKKLQVMLAPTAAGILSYKLPKYHQETNQIDLIGNFEHEAYEIVDVSNALYKHKEEQIYYNTDHHWTSLGAYYAYQYWQPQTLPLTAYEMEELSNEFLGTLYSKVKIMPKQKDVMEAYYLNAQQNVQYNLDGIWHNDFYERHYLKTKDKYSAYFNGNQSITQIKGYGNKGKLLIIKDSYANTFAQFSVADFSEVHLIDLRYFKMPLSEWIESERYDEVLLLYNLKNFTEENLFLLK